MSILNALAAWALVSVPLAIVAGRAVAGPRHPADRSSVANMPGVAMAAALGAATLLVISAAVLPGLGSAATQHFAARGPRTATRAAHGPLARTLQQAMPLVIASRPVTDTPITPRRDAAPVAATAPAPEPDPLPATIIDLAAWFPEPVSTATGEADDPISSTRKHERWHGRFRQARGHDEAGASSR